ncbi:sialate O-acetylesterase [Victivallis vadensis]|uniref:sialate O-acetylesterase n=1 Tax=Victivallis vadensis TaxID=172901 RepID=UPI00307E210F
MLKLAKLFGNHAVLQRDRAIPVWGWTEPFEIVEGSLGGVPAVARAGDDGRFLLRFPPRPAGGPLKLEVRGKNSGETVSFSDILVGEVWIAGGQSNMELKIRELPAKCEAVRAEAGKLPQLRMLTVPRRAQPAPMADVAADWQVAASECVPEWSAIGYFFARKLHRELNVPVGIVSSNWGGTVAEAWISRETLIRNPDFASQLEAYERNLYAPEMWESLSGEELAVEYPPDSEQAWFRRILPPPPENRGVIDGWAAPEFDDSDWRQGELPCFWKELGLDINGVVWFRREIEIPAAWQGRELSLNFGAIDKHDITYFNGVEVGRTGQDYETVHWDQPRTYRIPAELVRAGKAVIAVRNYSFIYNGGLHGTPDKMWIAPAGEECAPLALSGVWKFKPEFEYSRLDDLKKAMGPGNPNSCCMLFDTMIRPLIPMAMRGVIWYQGESNESAPEYYERLMRDLIADWRFRWGQGDFPFLQVLLAGFRNPADYDDAAAWPYIREAQSRAAQATGNLAASALDLGEAADIHPRRKAEVGERLALAALEQAYRQPVIGSGPVYREMVREAEAIRVWFDHIGSGLTAHGTGLKGFVIAGADGVFKEAEAQIVENSVRVSAPEVSDPVAVRYAWADNPEEANLYNSAGLPATPFRTDRFPR